MGSVKDLICDDSPAGKLYKAPERDCFGQGAWNVKGTFSVADLKEQIPAVEIPGKAEALTMMTGAFFEHLEEVHSDISTCYLGVIGPDGEPTRVSKLIEKGDRSNIILMKLAHTPDSWCNGDLSQYRDDFLSGESQCGVSDVESIFRKGFPLGSSTFKRIFSAVGRKELYSGLSTYGETVGELKALRNYVNQEGLRNLPELEKVLKDSGLGEIIPNPGGLLSEIVLDTTTKFESSGDREIDQQEAIRLSGLSHEGYNSWVKDIVPRIAKEQIDFSYSKGLLNIDGKLECVSHVGYPVVTDFLCTTDENRLMIGIENNGQEWAIPSNKEIQRAIFRERGIYSAIEQAKRKSMADSGKSDNWGEYLHNVLEMREINLEEVARDSCNLMEYAIGEVANRILGADVFDTPAIETWQEKFMPFASKPYFITPDVF